MSCVTLCRWRIGSAITVLALATLAESSGRVVGKGRGDSSCCWVFSCCNSWNNKVNKKVLLRERRRHTARRVASARYADRLMGGGGLPHPVLDRGVHHPVGGGGWVGTPSSPDPGWVPWGTPLVSRMGYTPPTWIWDGVPATWTWDGVTHSPPTWTWDGVSPHLDLGWGIPLSRCELTNWKQYLPPILRMRAVITIHICALLLK